jgi:hypothetical protein
LAKRFSLRGEELAGKYAFAAVSHFQHLFADFRSLALLSNTDPYQN